MEDARTFVDQLRGWSETQPDAVALLDRDADGIWKSKSWREFWEAARAIGKGLMALGVQPGESVGIVGANRSEWVLSELGIMAIQAIPAPLYTTSSAEQFAYVLKHCGARVVLCDTGIQRAKLLACRSENDSILKEVVVWESEEAQGEGVSSLEALMALGNSVDDDAFDARVAAIDPSATAMLIYTSGTTGVPKAVQLTHETLVTIGNRIEGMYPELMLETTYRVVSYLPLCHVAEQVFTNVGAMKTGGSVYFCREITEVRDVLTTAHPTVFLGVPRVWEKMEVALRSKLAEATGVKGKLARWALKKEGDCFARSQATRAPCNPPSRRLAHRLVLSRIHKALGFDQLVVAGSGAAPISEETLRFFASIGIIIHEGYGMSETGGVATMPPYNAPKFGTVGKPIDGIELRIADDDEILLKGTTMTPGYLHMPQETAALFDEDGWLHTGDLGSIDEEGFVSITGRKKDLLITAGGKNVAPAELERLLQGIPGVGHAVVVGDRRPYLCALISLEPEDLLALGRNAGSKVSSLEEAVCDQKIRSFIEQRIESDCNVRVARYQGIKKFEILGAPLSEENGELTPTMKVKRSTINERYADVIDGMYLA